MNITNIRIQNFRSHTDATIELNKKSTLITGKNGSGKTSLLEAIYIAIQGSSFRSSDDEIIKYGNSWYRIDINFGDDHKRIIKFDSNKKQSRKTFDIDGIKKNRLTSNYKIPVILFEPEDLQLLSGSPNRRRNFLDKFLAQAYPSFSISLSRYNKALRHRNALLKQDNVTEDQLFPWNLILSEYAYEITSRRIELIKNINKQIKEIYKQISGVNDDIEIIYNGKEITKQELLQEFIKNNQCDKILGYTTIGPHRHDFIFKFNGRNACDIASRGENRSLILALKFIETDFLADIVDKKPIVLLDDVFSELDKNRQKLLTTHFSSYQTIITSTEAIEVKGVKNILLS